jgi:hypothetical protein
MTILTKVLSRACGTQVDVEMLKNICDVLWRRLGRFVAPSRQWPGNKRWALSVRLLAIP